MGFGVTTWNLYAGFIWSALNQYSLISAYCDIIVCPVWRDFVSSDARFQLSTNEEINLVVLIIIWRVTGAGSFF